MKNLLNKNIVNLVLNGNRIKSVKAEVPYGTLVTDTVATLKATDFSVGDTVMTNGYYNKGDGGGATYNIMTYDDWINTLHFSVKALSYKQDRWGLGNSNFIKNPVDGYGNHKLDNGLVACIQNPNGANGHTVKVEQWGVFEGRDDNTEALIHLLGNMKTGKILFGKNKRYIINFREHNEAYYNMANYFGQAYIDAGFESQKNNCKFNQYCATLKTRATTKPALGFVTDLVLDGNGCTFYIPDNEFCHVGYSDFALLEMGGYINGLEITGFNFESNGLNQYHMIASDGTINNMRTCNHTISYFSNSKYENGSNDNVYNANFITLESLGIVSDINEITTTFSNVNIHHNNFYANGTMVDTSDQGGDHILIINPTESENVFIEDNYFENWGRWVFAVDLGGNGERFYNYKFNRNKCVQTEDNCIVRENGAKFYRGLGWIDFEARKCWTGLEVCNNEVYGANGWAFNGNGKISNNITVKDNIIKRASFSTWRSIYPYAFEWYSCHIKDMLFDNNTVSGETIRLGATINNITVQNCSLSSPVNIYGGMYGNIKFDNCTMRDISIPVVRVMNADVPNYISDETNENYVPITDRECNFIFTNNYGSFEGSQGNPLTLYSNDPNRYSHLSFIIENNTLGFINAKFISCKPVSFNPNQMATKDIFKAAMARFTDTSWSAAVNNPVMGSGYWEAGSIVSNNISIIKRTEQVHYYKGLNYKAGNALRTTTSGYLPMNGTFKKAESDYVYSSGGSVKYGNILYTMTDAYVVNNDGTLGDSKPTHTSGTELNGDVSLTWIAPLAQLEVVTI